MLRFLQNNQDSLPYRVITNKNIPNSSFKLKQHYNPFDDENIRTINRKDNDDVIHRNIEKNYSQSSDFTQSMNIARQMAQGNGKYVKGKGWQ